MTERDPILAAVDELAPAFERAGLDELELEVGDIGVRLARPRAAAPVGEVEDPTSNGGCASRSAAGHPALQATDEAGPARDGG